MSSETLMYALYAGFVFTPITILLTLHPDPTQIVAQITLFYLAFTFHVLRAALIGQMYWSYRCVRIAPPLEPDVRPLSLTCMLSQLLMDGAVVLMFLLRNLAFLALANLITNALFVIFCTFKITKPIDKIWKKELVRK